MRSGKILFPDEKGETPQPLVIFDTGLRARYGYFEKQGPIETLLPTQAPLALGRGARRVL
jgi:hypothetical protein